MDVGNEYEDETMSTEILKEIHDGSKYHLTVKMR